MVPDTPKAVAPEVSEMAPPVRVLLSSVAAPASIVMPAASPTALVPTDREIPCATPAEADPVAIDTAPPVVYALPVDKEKLPDASLVEPAEAPVLIMMLPEVPQAAVPVDKVMEPPLPGSSYAVLPALIVTLDPSPEELMPTARLMAPDTPEGESPVLTEIAPDVM